MIKSASVAPGFTQTSELAHRNRARGHLAGPWPHFARSSHARLGIVGLRSSSARSSFVSLRLVVVTIAGLGSSLTRVGSSTRSGGTTAAGLPRFRGDLAAIIVQSHVGGPRYGSDERVL